MSATQIERLQALLRPLQARRALSAEDVTGVVDALSVFASSRPAEVGARALGDAVARIVAAGCALRPPEAARVLPSLTAVVVQLVCVQEPEWASFEEPFGIVDKLFGALGAAAPASAQQQRSAAPSASAETLAAVLKACAYVLDSQYKAPAKPAATQIERLLAYAERGMRMPDVARHALNAIGNTASRGAARLPPPLLARIFGAALAALDATAPIMAAAGAAAGVSNAAFAPFQQQLLAASAKATTLTGLNTVVRASASAPTPEAAPQGPQPGPAGARAADDLCASALRCLVHIIPEARTVHLQALDRLVLHVCHALALTGPAVHVTAPASATTHGGLPSPRAGPSSSAAGGAGRASLGGAAASGAPVGRRRPSWSGSESESGAGEVGSVRSKLRVQALALVASIARTSPKPMSAHWSLFVPDTPRSPQVSLLSVLAFDTSAKVRSQAAQTLQALIEGGKTFLAAADELTASGASFTTLSRRLAGMIREMHTALLSALHTETVVAPLVHLVKCTTALVLAVPYNRLAPGYLNGIASRVHALLMHGDQTVRVASCACLGALFSLDSRRSEVEPLLFVAPLSASSTADGGAAGAAPAAPAAVAASSSAAEPSAVLAGLLNLSVRDAHVAVRTEALETVAAAIVSHPVRMAQLYAHWSRAMLAGLQHEDARIRAASYQVLEAHARAAFEDGAALMPSGDHWMTLIMPHVSTGCVDESHSVRATAAAIVSHIDVGLVTAHERGALLTLLFSLASDEHGAVRAAACRALGVFATAPVLLSDGHFITDAGMALARACSDAVANVRVRGFWALANWADALTRPGSCVADLPHDAVTLPALRVLLGGCGEPDKIRVNAVRGLGHLLAGLPLALLDGAVVAECTQALLAATEEGPFKLRWNACYAAGVALSRAELALPDTLVLGLMRTAGTCPNFKTRTNAVAALVSASRGKYSGVLAQAIRAFFEAVRASHDNSDTAAFQYRGGLHERLHEWLRRLLTVVERPEDHDALAAHADDLTLLVERGIAQCRLAAQFDAASADEAPPETPPQPQAQAQGAERAVGSPVRMGSSTMSLQFSAESLARLAAAFADYRRRAAGAVDSGPLQRVALLLAEYERERPSDVAGAGGTASVGTGGAKQ